MASVSTGIGDRISISISGDNRSDETLKLMSLALLLRRKYEFPFGINLVQFSIFNFQGRPAKVRRCRIKKNRRPQI